MSVLFDLLNKVLHHVNIFHARCDFETAVYIRCKKIRIMEVPDFLCIQGPDSSPEEKGHAAFIFFQPFPAELNPASPVKGCLGSKKKKITYIPVFGEPVKIKIISHTKCLHYRYPV